MYGDAMVPLCPGPRGSGRAVETRAFDTVREAFAAGCEFRRKREHVGLREMPRNDELLCFRGDNLYIHGPDGTPAHSRTSIKLTARERGITNDGAIRVEYRSHILTALPTFRDGTWVPTARVGRWDGRIYREKTLHPCYAEDDIDFPSEGAAVCESLEVAKAEVDRGINWDYRDSGGVASMKVRAAGERGAADGDSADIGRGKKAG